MAAPLIATLTFNPSLDEDLASAGDLVLGATNRCTLDAFDPGGKGINAARVIHRLGRLTLALGFAGGATGQILRARLDAEDIAHELAEVDEPTRCNVIVFEHASGRHTRFYLPGARVEPAQALAVRTRLQALAPGTVVLGGSVPPGLPETIYADFVRVLRADGVRTIVDTSGAPLAAALAARPTLIKPDVEEAEELLGRRLPDDGAVLRAANEIRQSGPEFVVISQGAAGAIGVGPDGAWKALAPAVVAHASVGSGDSMVGGFAIALNEQLGFEEGLRLGTATGTATATVRGTQLCSAADVARLLANVELRPLVALSGR